jgi:hypothetical protein
MNMKLSLQALVIVVGLAYLGIRAYFQVLWYPNWNPARRTLRQRSRIATLCSALTAICFGLIIYILQPQSPFRGIILSALMVAVLLMSYRLPLAINISLRRAEAFPAYVHLDVIRILPFVTSIFVLATF